MKKSLLACAVLGMAAAAQAATINVTYQIQDNTPAAGWATATVYASKAGAMMDKLTNATFTIAGTGNRFMNQNFVDGDGTTQNTTGLDFWSTDATRGASTYTQPGSTAFQGLNAPANASWDGNLPMPAATKAFDTHFLGDFALGASNAAFQNRWFTQGSLSSSVSTLSGTQLAFSGSVQADPLPLAQLVFDRTKSVSFTVQELPTDTAATGTIAVPEPATLSLAGLGVLGLVARRRR